MAKSVVSVKAQKRTRKPVPATVARDIARAANKETRSRELVYAAILARLWPSFVTVPAREDEMFPFIVCIDSPAGRLAYRITASDRETGFEHVTAERKKDDAPCSAADKHARLLHLASEGWDI